MLFPILIILLLLSIIIGMYLFAEQDPFDYERLSGYDIPKIFYSDYNRICLQIFKMTKENADNVMHEISSFEDKYAQIVDSKPYHEAVAMLMDTFRKRHFFLNYNK